MKRILIALLIAATCTTPAWADDDDAAIKAAIEKGLKRIEAGITNYPKHRQCFSCHHQAVAVMSMTSAQKHGFKVDADLLQKQIDFSLKTFRNKATIAKGQGVGGESTSVVYILQTLATVDRPHDDTAGALVDYLLVRQRKDGTWPLAPSGDRPPTMGSMFTNVGLAMGALKRYGPPPDAEDAEALQERIDAAIAKGRAWLLANQPVSTEDKVFHLRGLVDAGADAKSIEAARDRLLKDQREAGDWSQLAKMSGDAYATATALTALRHAGLDAKNPGYRKGVRFLLDKQEDDGAWIVETRSRPLQKFFDNGDTGGKSQFISFAATNWSVMALLETVPVKKDK